MARKSAARFEVLAAPFNRPTLLHVKITPVGKHDATIEIRQYRRRGGLEIGLGEVAGWLVERAAKKAAAERPRRGRGRKAG